MPELRKYQSDAVHNLRIALSKNKRQIAIAPCAAGKTIIAANIIQSVLSRGKKVIFLVDRIVLAEQTSRLLDKYSIPHGIMQAQNERYEPHQLCQIWSGQTLIRRKTPDDIALIIQDEAHCKSKALEMLIAYNPDAYFIGFTATPFSKGLGKIWDGTVIVTTAQKLTDEKHLAPVRVFAKKTPDLGKVKTIAGEFHQGQLSDETDKPTLVADVVDTWRKHGENRQTICFAVDIAHSKHLMQQFNSHGMPAEQIDCYTNYEDRQDMLKRFENCKTRILISVAVLSVGFDAPIASCCILAVATKSLIKYIQCVGRVARVHEKKVDAIVFDHGGNTERHGFITDDFDYTLDDGKHAEAGKRKERDAPLPKKCPSCDYVKPSGVRKCPSCGFTPEFVASPEFEEGELAEIKQKGQRKNNRDISKEQKQAFYSGLITYCRDKGFKEGFAAHQYKQKMGVWPNAMNKVAGSINDDVTGWITHIAIAQAAQAAKMKRDLKSA